MSLHGWEKLQCACGSENFLATHEIQWHENQGTANKQSGWQCTKCRTVISTADMIQSAQKKRLEEKIKELQAQQVG